MVDLRVTLTDGKAHSVDSSDMAFQTAGALALRDAVSEATVALLEPVDAVKVVVDDDHVGPVMTDLQTRRGRVLGTEPDGTGWTTVHAEVPESEIVRYADRPALGLARHGRLHPRADRLRADARPPRQGPPAGLTDLPDRRGGATPSGPVRPRPRPAGEGRTRGSPRAGRTGGRRPSS